MKKTVSVTEDQTTIQIDNENIEKEKIDTGQNVTLSEMSSPGQQTITCSESNSGQNVFVIESSGDLNMSNFEPYLMKCVKQALTNSDGQHSFMIVNKDTDEFTGEPATYIIDMEPLGKCASGSISNEINHFEEMVTPTTSKEDGALNDTSVDTCTQRQESLKLDPSFVQTELNFDGFEEEVEFSYNSCPSMIDLNNSKSGTDVSIEIVCSQGDLPSASQHSEASDTGKFFNKPGKVSVSKNLLSNSLPSPSPETTSAHPSQLISEISIKEGGSTNLGLLPKESYISTKYLVHKTAGEKSHRKIKQENHLHSVTSKTGMDINSENCESEPVIAMILSSSNELKDIIHKFNVNSSAVITSSRTETSHDDDEAKENSTCSHHSSQDVQCVKSSTVQPESTVTLTDTIVSVLQSVSAGGVVYRCAECGYCSHNKHYYKQHVDLVHNEDRPYKCPHCDYAGKRRHALLEHLVVHSNIRPFTCDHCNASFRKKGHLTNHIKLHTSHRLMHCGVCNIQLPDTAAFESHLNKIHNTDKLYKCRLCDHTVVDKELMLKHLHEHNEAVMYSCPKCPSLFNSEENLVLHLKGDHHFSFVPKSVPKQGEAVNKYNLDTASIPQPTSIICSECGLVSKNTDMMQKHMWEHIKKDTQLNLQSNDIKMSLSTKDETCNNLGVLKMNVDLGQKTLPKDVVYQCSSCSFTSRDNSVFIKHMLVHKTQEKKQITDFSELSRPPIEKSLIVEGQVPTSAQSVYKQGNLNSGSQSDTQAKSDSGVPFIYDKASARFRCVICGYHCEFQRTIKAHIWKHSGHQNIEYPTFDHVSSTKNSSPTIHVLSKKEIFQQVDGLPLGTSISVGSTSSETLQQDLPILRTRSGDTVQLVPVNPRETSYNQANLIQIKNNSIVLPATCGEASAASKFLESIAFSGEPPSDARLKEEVVGQPSTTSLITVDVSDQVRIEIPVNVPTKNKSNSFQKVLKKFYTCPVKMTAKLNGKELDDGESNGDDRCFEPSVVVEVMDTVPSETGLTGLKSQQGSPRIPDLDVRMDKSFRKALEQRSSCDLDSSLSDGEKTEISLTGAKTDDFKFVLPEDHHSYSTRLRCPTCDCLLTEDFKSHLLSCQKGTDEDTQLSELDIIHESAKTKLDFSCDNDDIDSPSTEDTDSLESCYEIANSGSSTGQQKSGICSSLLAVIEQLRERSRSESEEDKQNALTAKKGGKKKIQDNEELNLISVEDLQNIEKISENGSDKFRCSLCHYSSNRICNIKLHMKTHRQKKPSECSLCDFSSTSPEALQEHMLKHCKVRTYPCKFCPQSFNHKSTLRGHLRAHKDQDPFLCAYCVFETTNPIEYRDHMQVHSGCSSRLRCPGCDLVLSSKEALTAHLLTCKGSLRKSRLIINKSDSLDLNVDQDFDKVEQSNLIEAATISHACVVHGCSFSSTNLKELQDHLSIHCNPSLLVCNLCDFKALHSRSLKSHMKRHANDQRYVQQPLEQYKCNLCGYVCHHLPSLKSHMWRHASEQCYSYEFTNDVINAAIDHDTRVDADGDADDPELLDRVINSERKIMEGELTKFSKGDGHRPICWVTFRCCSCGFETINKAKLNVHMRSHSDIIQKALDMPRKVGHLHNSKSLSSLPISKAASKRSNITADSHLMSQKIIKRDETVPI